MRILRNDQGIEIRAPAKINLFLEVMGKREDGYHELDTVMLAISLCDRLQFRKRMDSEITLRVICPPATNHLHCWKIPEDSSNLVIRSLEACRKSLGVDSGMDILLWKGIPALAGMGGGSSDAAACIVAAFALWRNRYDSTAAGAIASSLGSDLNFFLEGYSNDSGGVGSPHLADGLLARCTGRGEIIEPRSIRTPLHFVTVHPPEGCSTKQVFARLETNDKKISNHGLLTALDDGNMSQLGTQLFNRLESSAGLESRWISETRADLEREPILGQSMSGSGSARFALCRSLREALSIGKRVRSRLPVQTFAVSSWHVPSLETQLRSLGVDVERRKNVTT